MSDPRVVNNDGVDAEFRTYLIDNSTITYDMTQTGGSAQVTAIPKAVTLSADKTVALAADGDAVLGALVKVEAGDATLGPGAVAVVQVDGVTHFAGGTGAALTRGKHIVGALLSAAKGYVREVNTAVAAELGVMDHTLIEVSTSTDVIVELG